jgi:hypothetical protein
MKNIGTFIVLLALSWGGISSCAQAQSEDDDDGFERCTWDNLVQKYARLYECDYQSSNGDNGPYVFGCWFFADTEIHVEVDDLGAGYFKVWRKEDNSDYVRVWQCERCVCDTCKTITCSDFREDETRDAIGPHYFY